MALLPEISARAALHACSVMSSLELVELAELVELLLVASTLAPSSLCQRPVRQNIFAAA
jgi:hypothetical protein